MTGYERKQRIKWIDECAVFEPLRKAAGLKRGFGIFIDKDDAEWAPALAKAKLKCRTPSQPAMPTLSEEQAAMATTEPFEPVSVASNPLRKECSGKKPHQEHVANAGVISNGYYGMVHTPVPMSKALKIPDAKAAVDKEWDTLSKKAWNVKNMKPKSQVKQDAARRGEGVHFESLMDLCHEKHSELKVEGGNITYKGRVVFRGDQTKDEAGRFAVFTEQAASA